MCVIIEQKPGYTLPYNLLENAVFNNPDGYGLILKDQNANKIQIIKKMKCDPKEIYDLLKDNEDIERYLHVRYKTEGEVSEVNLHPFTSYYSDELQVYFMHNGTLQNYKPKDEKVEWRGNIRVVTQEKETISDSNKFNLEVLQPFLQRFTGEKGKADYHDPYFTALLDKFWGGGYNQGLLVSNKYPPLFINQKDWKVIKADNNEEFYASNDLYFRELKRGPEFERRKKEKEEKERAERESRFRPSNTNTPAARAGFNKLITELKDVDLREHLLDMDRIGELMSDFDIWSMDGLAALAYMGESEVSKLMDNLTPEERITLFIWMTTCYDEVYNKYSNMVDFVETLRKKGKVSDEEVKNLQKAA